MKTINRAAYILTPWAMCVVVLLFGEVDHASAQVADRVDPADHHIRLDEARQVLGAKPNQLGVVCDGKFYSATDLRCTGAFYRADEYTAVQLAKLNAALVVLNKSLDDVDKTTGSTQDLLAKQVQAFNNDLRAYIEKKFADLPNDILQSAAIQNLKKSLTDYVDQRLKTAAPVSPTPSSPH